MTVGLSQIGHLTDVDLRKVMKRAIETFLCMTHFVLWKVIPNEKDQTLTASATAVPVSRGQYSSGLTDVTSVCLPSGPFKILLRSRSMILLRR